MDEGERRLLADVAKLTALTYVHNTKLEDINYDIGTVKALCA